MNNIVHKPIIFMFSGQGSHYYHMGRELYDKHPCFKQWMLTGEEIFNLQTGISLLKELYSNHHNKTTLFNRTLFTHAAIFIVEYALARTLISEGIIPAGVLGTSLGEFTAATLADCIDFETALKTIISQSELIENYSPNASMLAILTSPHYYEKQPLLFANTSLASINFPEHFVVTASIEKIEFIEQQLKNDQIAYQRLAVSHGFHSSLIDAAESHFLKILRSLTFKHSTLQLISCAESRTLSTFDKNHLWQIIRKPVFFEKTFNMLEKENQRNGIYLDLGPSGTLATFAKYNFSQNSNSTIFSTLTPFGNGIDNLLKIKGALNL